MTMVALRESPPGLGSIFKTAVPFPDPLAPLTNVIQLTPVAVLQAQPGGPFTVTLTLPPEVPTETLAPDSVKVQATYNVVPSLNLIFGEERSVTVTRPS